jgi:hypothetical protein
MKMRSRLLGIIALAAVSLAATHCRRAKPVPAATASPPVAKLPGVGFRLARSLVPKQ